MREAVVRLHEFERIPLSRLREMRVNLSHSELSHFVEVVNAIHGRRHRVFSIEYSPRRREHYLRAHGSIGFAYYVRRNERITFQVLPKPFRADPDDRRSIQFFLHLLNLAKGMRLERGHLNAIGDEYSKSGNIDELFKSMYVLLLAKALGEGLYLEYGEIEESSRVIRGRILVSRMARRPPWETELPVRYSLMLENNPLNRILKGALSVVVSTAKWKPTKRLGGVLIGAFQGVDFPYPGDGARVNFNHLNERFRTVFNLAETILSAFTGLGTGDRIFPGIFISMDELFEALIYQTIRSALGRDAEVRFEESLPHIIRNARDYEIKKRAVFMMGNPLPDITIRTGKGACVVEVKYRDLYVRVNNEGRRVRKLVRNSSELYQAYAYAKLFGGGVLLIYPRLEGRYNYWLPDFFAPGEGDVLRFFDGTKLGIFGYEISRIGDGVSIDGSGVYLDDELRERLRGFLLNFCGEL
ncbi:restriction endonuclease [Thermococcus sp.]|uniref:5-methylcytosine restriction system specificity protein McrC n=1 Tax=Thermococcus sp. TaxID=35749 RepID=UPI0026153DF7|nr:restriction endonuclease [Thermococcus sp.]